MIFSVPRLLYSYVYVRTLLLANSKKLVASYVALPGAQKVMDIKHSFTFIPVLLEEALALSTRSCIKRM